MLQYTSEEALNGILNIIDTVVKEHAQALAKKPENSYQEVGDLVTALIGGVAAGSSSNVNLGTQIKDLADGMSMFKDKGITDSDAKSVAGMISTLGESISKLEFSEANVSSVQSVAQALVMFGSIDSEIVDRINRLGLIDFVVAERMNEFMRTLGGIDVNVGLADLIKTFITTLNDININSVNFNDLVSSFTSISSMGPLVDEINKLSDIDYTIGTEIKTFVNNLSEGNVDTEKVHQAIECVVMLGQIDSKILKNIEKLNDIDYSGVDRLKEFLNKLNFSVSGEIDEKSLRRDINMIASLLKSVSDIVDGEKFKFSTLFAPARGKLMGKAISKFFEELIKAVPEQEIKVDIKGIADLINGLLPLVKNDSEYSIRRMKKILNGKNGAEIGEFFKEMLNKFPTDKEVSKSIVGVANLMKVLSDFSIKDYIKMKKVFTKANGEEIGNFFKAILTDLPENNAKGLRAISDFLKELTSLGIFGALTLKLMSTILTEKTGKAINGFANAIVKDFDEEKSKLIKNFAESVKFLSQGMMMFTGTMLLMAAGIFLFGVESILVSIGITIAFTGAMLWILKKFSNSDKDVKSGSEALMNVSKAITLLTLDVLMLAGVAMLLESVAWESLGKVGAIFGALVVAVWISQIISDKWNKGGEQALKAMLGISLLLVVAVASIALMAWVSQEFRHEDIEYGLITLGIVVGSAVSIVWLLSKMDQKDMDNSVKTLWNLVGIIGVTALLIGFVIAPLADSLTAAIAGLTVVGVTILAMIGMVYLLTKMEEKKLDEARKTLMVLTGMLAVVSIISAFVLPMIAQNIGDAIVGAIFSLVVCYALIGMAWVLGEMDVKKANEVQQTLMVLTGMFAIIAVVSSFLLPMIGALMGDTLLGLVVVAAIMAGMYFMTKLLSSIENDALESSYKTLAVLTVMLVAVSLIALFILPKIAENAMDTFIGGVVVLGIIALMVGITWLMSKIGDETLKLTYTALAVLTVCLLAVSLIALFILPAIGEKWETSALGAVVVLGVVALMVLMVWGLSKIDDKKLKWGLIAMVAMTFILLGVSLIVSELLIPIGQQWEAVALGGVVVLAVIGIMTGIIALAGKIDLKQIGKGALAVAAAEALLVGIALIINEYFVPVGKNGEEAAIGGAIILGTLTIMTSIIAVAGQMNLSTIAKGALAVAGIGGVLWALGEMLPSYLDLCIQMYENDKAVAIGGLEIVATLAVWGLIMTGVGFLMSYGAGFLAMGAVAIASIGAVLWSLGEMLPSYISVCIQMFDNAKETAIGGLEIVATLGVWALIMTGLGALMSFGAPFLLAGEATIVSLSAVLWTISQTLPDYIELCKNASENSKVIDKGSDAIIELIAKFGLLITAIGSIALIPLVGIAMGAGAGIVMGLMQVIKVIGDSLDPFFDVLNKIKEYKITSATIENFTKLFIGSGVMDEDPKSLYGSIKRICDAMNEIGLYSATMAGTIAKNLTPIFKTLGMFIDIVGRICSMKYVEAWNADGTPASYGTISPAMFRQAGMAISKTFGTFLTELGIGLDKLKDVSLAAIAKLSVGIGPVMEAVSKFTDTILNVLNTKIEAEWDKDGNPTKWRKFDAQEFALAATTITENFSMFLDILTTKLEPLSEKAGIVLNQLKDGVQPVVSAACALTDSIMGVIKGADYTVMENGKEVKKHIDFTPEKFKEAGGLVGQEFVDFITLIYNSFSAFDKEVEVDVSYTTTEGSSYAFGLYDSRKQVTKFKKEKQTVNIVGKLLANMASVQSIVSAAAEFVEVVAKTSEYLEKYKMEENGKKLAGLVVDFVTAMTNKFSAQGYDEKIKTSMDNLELTQKLVLKFSNAYAPLSKMIEEYKNKIVTNDLIDIFYGVMLYLSSSESLAKLANLKNLDIEAMKSMVAYSKQMRKVAEELADLAEEMNSADITKAITKFLTDIELLTQENSTKRVSASQKALKQFSADLKLFTKQVVFTRKTVIKFTNSMNDATKSLKKFDDLIIDNEKKRNDAIKHMAELIERTAEAVKSLQKNIESLDQNKILENFKAIAELLELAKAEGEKRANPDNNQNNNQQNGNQNSGQNNNNRNQDGGNTTVVNNGRTTGKQMCNFYFQNVSFSGFMETKNI